jgi:hypothetical protein
MVNMRKTGSIDAPPITVAQRSRIRFTRSAQGFRRLYLISTVKIPARSQATTAEFVMPLKLGVIITCRKLTLARPITSANCSRRVWGMAKMAVFTPRFLARYASSVRVFSKDDPLSDRSAES